MARGTVSDTTDERVMNSADATLTIDVESLSPGQVLEVLQQLGIDRADPYYVGELMGGEDVRDSMGDIEIHLTAEEALNALTGVGVLDAPDEVVIEDE